MKNLLISLGLVIGVLVFGLLLRWGYLQDKQQEVLLYRICIEQGCSDSVCKFFSTFPAAIQIHCGVNGFVSRS